MVQDHLVIHMATDHRDLEVFYAFLRQHFFDHVHHDRQVGGVPGKAATAQEQRALLPQSPVQHQGKVPFQDGLFGIRFPGSQIIGPGVNGAHVRGDEVNLGLHGFLERSRLTGIAQLAGRKNAVCHGSLLGNSPDSVFFFWFPS